MERGLLVVAPLLGIALWILGLFLAPRALASSRPAPPGFGIGLGIALLGLLATRPSQAPFHPGGVLGMGWLIGGLLASAAAWPAWRRPDRGVLLTAGPALAAAALPLLFLRASVMDGLAGVALGALAVTAALASLSDDARYRSALAGGTAFTAALVSAMALGIFRHELTPEWPRLAWSVALLALTAGGLLFGLVARLLPPRGGVAVFFLLSCLELWWLTTRIAPAPRLFAVAAVGLGAGALALAILRATKPESRPPALGAFLAVGAFLVGTQLLQGLGATVAALAFALALIALSHRDEDAPRTAPLLGLCALLAVYRFVIGRYGDELRSLTLADSFTLTAFLAGALLPGALARTRRGGPGLVGAGTALAAALVALTALAGTRPALPLLAGLILGVVVFAFSVRSDESAEPEGEELAPLLALGAALALAQFAAHLDPLYRSAYDLSRPLRAALVVAAALVGIAGAWFARGRRERQP